MATEASVLVTASGSTNVGSFTQTWTIGGTPTTVYIQALALVDATTGMPGTIDANGSLHTAPFLGTPENSGPLSTSIAGGGSANATLSAPAVTNLKVGSLQHAVFSATSPCSWELQWVDASGTVHNVCTAITPAYGTYDFKPGMIREVQTDTSDGTHSKFQALCTNLDTNSSASATVNAYFNWAEN